MRSFRWLSAVVVAALAVLPLLARAQTFSSPVTVSKSADGVIERAPQIQRVGDRYYMTWIQCKPNSANGDIMFSVSNDAGKSFSEPVRVTNTLKVNSYFQRAGEFIVDPQGTIHLIWAESRSTPDILYTRSSDEGQTWSAIRSLSNDSNKHVEDFTSIACDSSGNLYVAWIDSRDRKNNGSATDHLYFTRSFDGGNVWDAPVRANIHPDGGIGGTCECCRTSMVSSPDGEVTIAFRSNIENLRNIFVARSKDKGSTWEPIVRIQKGSWMINACPATGPNIRYDNANATVLVGWRDAHSGSGNVYFASRPSGSDSSTINVQLNSITVNANFADVAVAPNGAIGAVYVARDHGADNVFARFSFDNGATWTSEQAISPSSEMQEFPRILFNSDNTATIVWHDMRNDRGDIMMTHSSVISEQANVAVVKDYGEPTVYPNPSKPNEWLRVGHTDRILEILDRRGRRLEREKRCGCHHECDHVQSPDVPGVYYLRSTRRVIPFVVR